MTGRVALLAAPLARALGLVGRRALLAPPLAQALGLVTGRVTELPQRLLVQKTSSDKLVAAATSL